MPKVDFSKVNDVKDFTPLPAGKYPCKLIEVDETRTQFDSEMWKLRFQVISGEYANRILFDNMVFSEAAMKRVKLICSRLGLNVSSDMDLTPEMLIGKTCYVIVEVEDYDDLEGKTKKRNVVSFAGYEMMDGNDAAASEEGALF